jgi:hypothetical protein
MVISASDLIVADLRSSDPYVKILYGPDQKHKTSVKKATLNPTWNEVRRPHSPTHTCHKTWHAKLRSLLATAKARRPHTTFASLTSYPANPLTPLLLCPPRSSR